MFQRKSIKGELDHRRSVEYSSPPVCSTGSNESCIQHKDTKTTRRTTGGVSSGPFDMVNEGKQQNASKLLATCENKMRLFALAELLCKLSSDKPVEVSAF